jgi:PhnB protein
MATFNTYLNFNGNTEDAFNFYKSVFGGEFATLMRFKDTPEAGKLSPADQDKIMHVALPLSNGNLLMGTDVVESIGQKLEMGNNMHISIDTSSENEATDLFAKLSDGATIKLPMGKMFWGSHFGMLNDKFGVQWMVSYHPAQQ